MESAGPDNDMENGITKNMRNVHSQIDMIQELITMPKVIAEIMEELDRDDAVTHKVIKLVESDPSLTTSILRVANSPFYGMRRQIETVSGAITLLGLSEVTNLLIMFFVKQRFLQLPIRQEQYLNLLWRHSVSTAALASLIAKEYKIETKGREFTAGLLHDLGKIVLVQCFPAELEKTRRLIHRTGTSDTHAESEIVGIPHGDIGGLLAERWNLPHEYIDVLKFHHAPEVARLNQKLVAVVRFADLIAEFSGSGIGEQPPETLFENDEIFALLSRHQPTMHVLGQEAVTARLIEKHTEQQGLLGLF
jgi:HD-like signal output (HDOD) protein